ncbi:hypothetical protein ES705_41715 [subsurface metagenome]
MPLPSFSGDIEKNIIRHIKYRGTIRTGEIIVDNGDGTYDVKIALSDMVYPSIETIHYEMVFAVGEMAVLAFEYGSKENPKIIGHGKKIAQVPVEVEVDYSGTARVETLDAYSVTAILAYLEGRIYLGEAGNCTRRGFQYGTTISYGLDIHTDGSYGDGSYAIQATSLNHTTTYHFRAYIIDENGDTKYGEDNIFTTVILGLISCDDDTHTIYIHTGITSSISSSFLSPSTSPYGLTYDGTNLISCDVAANRIYIHTGVSSGVTSSFLSPSGYITGLTYDGTNLISCDAGTNKIYIHSGITSSISSFFTTPVLGCYGLTYDGTNLISCDYFTHTIYIHSGVSSGVSSSFASPDNSPSGLAFDGTNLISCDAGTKMIYIHSGITSSISSSFASPAAIPMGLYKST